MADALITWLRKEAERFHDSDPAGAHQLRTWADAVEASTEGEAVAWRMVQRDGSVLSLQDKPYHEGFAEMMARDCGCSVQALGVLPLSGISAEQIEMVLRQATIDYHGGAAGGRDSIHAFEAKRVAAFLNLTPTGVNAEGGDA